MSYQLIKHIMLDDLKRVLSRQGKEHLIVWPKSPMKDFDCLVCDSKKDIQEWGLQITFIVSKYKAIDGNQKGRIILVKKDPAGLTRVNSTIGDEVCFTLANGAEFGRKEDVSYYDLFPTEAERKGTK